MKKLLYLLSLFIYMGTANAQQSYTITGIVTDEKNAPIASATVFLGDSRKATVSDNDGRFVLTKVQRGSYNLVIKMIGYVVLQHSFMLGNGDARFRFKLQEDNVVLNTVNISAISSGDRKRYLVTFIRCFFGTSANAAQCKILNSDIIVLKYDKKRDILKARTDDFLIIENSALGYRIKYLLNSFIYDRSGADVLTSFEGNVFFEDMEGNPRQKKRWEEARAEAYLGSQQHFFRSLFSNTLESEGFVSFEMLNRSALAVYEKKKWPIPTRFLRPVKLFKSYVKNRDDNLKKFNLGLLKKDSVELCVVYTRKTEPYDFLAGGIVLRNVPWMPAGQKTVLRPLYDTVTINKNGDLSPVGGMISVGYWMWGKMSSSLPSDYQIPAGMEFRATKNDD
jgi:hypothetical protein